MKWFAALVMLFIGCHANGTNGYERFEQNGKVGIKDGEGHVIVPAAFDALGWSDGGFSLIGQITGYRQGGQWGLLNLKKEFITKAIFRSLTYPGGNRVLVSRETSTFSYKYGCINLEGELVIPLDYDEIIIHELRAVVMQKHGPRYEYGLIDLNNRSVLPLSYKQITPLGTLRYAVQDFSNKVALCSEEGKWSTGFDIDSVSKFQFDLAILYKDLRLGVIDRFGDIRVQPIYREVKITGPGVVRVRKPDAWKIMDLQQRELHGIEADELQSLGNNRNLITLGGKSGLVDSLLKVVSPLEYDYVGPVLNEKMVVKKNGLYGLIRSDLSTVLPFNFDSLILQGHLVVASSKEFGRKIWNLYDTVGVKKTATPYDLIGPYNQSFFPVLKNGYVGSIDQLGKERIACVYDSILQVYGSHCSVKFRGQYGIITLNDEWRLPPQRNKVQLLPEDLYMERQGAMKMIKDLAGNIIYFSDQSLTVFPDHMLERLPDGTEKEINFRGQIVSRRKPKQEQNSPLLSRGSGGAALSLSKGEVEGLTLIKRDGKYGFVDSRGRLRIANRYEAAGNFQSGLAPVMLLGKWGIIDDTDQIVVQPTFDRMTIFPNGVAQVVRNKKHGLIDQHGKVLLELRYDSIRSQADQSFLLIQGGLEGLADPYGKILLEPRFESLARAGDQHVIVRQNGRSGVLTRDGMSVIPVQYDLLVYLPETGNFFARQKYPWETIELK